MISVSLIGGSGYTGGEALRILLAHPEFDVKQVTSESRAGKLVHQTHPNLRGATDLKFVSIADVEPADCYILGLPHGKAQDVVDELKESCTYLADLSADFRLHDAGLYQRYYGEEHRRPELLGEFVYAVPELNRAAISKAHMFSGAGCIATCASTSLRPLFEAGVVEDRRVFIDAKIGSSAAGASANPASHHPERAGCLRSFKPTNHRHSAELIEQLSVDLNGTVLKPEIYLSATSTDSVRGILTTSQVLLNQNLSEVDIRTIYRERYGKEPFVRIVKERRGIFRSPEPKLLAGTNFIDIGFEIEEDSQRLVVLGAIDNLVKGSSGNVIQSLNIRFGFSETLGLEFTGLHPI